MPVHVPVPVVRVPVPVVRVQVWGRGRGCEQDGQGWATPTRRAADVAGLARRARLARLAHLARLHTWHKPHAHGAVCVADAHVRTGTGCGAAQVFVSWAVWGHAVGVDASWPAVITIGAYNLLWTHSAWDTTWTPDPAGHFLHHNGNREQVKKGLGIFLDKFFGTCLNVDAAKGLPYEARRPPPAAPPPPANSEPAKKTG